MANCVTVLVLDRRAGGSYPLGMSNDDRSDTKRTASVRSELEDVSGPRGKGRAVRGANKKAGEKGPNLFPTKWKQFDDEPRGIYLAHLAQCGRHATAARLTGVGYHTPLRHRKEDPEFAAQCEAAMQIYIDALHEEAYRRAVDGIDEEYYHKTGEVSCVKTKYSDTLLLALLKRHDPGFKDRVEIDQRTLSLSRVELGSVNDLSEEDRLRILEVVQSEVGRRRSNGEAGEADSES